MLRRAVIILILICLSSIALALSAPPRVDTKVAKNSVTLSWDNVSGAAGYNVYRKEATDPVYAKINFSPVSTARFEDRTVAAGKDYLYVVRTLAADGTESGDSLAVGAPLMVINVDASVTTLRDKPVAARSIKTGKIVTFAAPGDVITYKLSFANKGFGQARNTKIEYDIPRGTVIAGVPVIRKGGGIKIEYYDAKKKKWQPKIEDETSVSRVRFTVAETLRPIVGEKEANGVIDLNVLITL